MDFKLTITMADPAGNRTAFAEGAVDPEHYAAVGAALLEKEELHAEQAGFLCPPRQNGIGRLEMMGGEFCGNASRSFGLLLGRRAGKKDGDTVAIEVSGSSRKLDVLLEEDGSWVSMPLPQRFDQITFESKAYPAVVLEGITHIILEDINPSDNLAHSLIEQAAQTTDADAVGAIFVNGKRMTPAVWVRATDSFVWEGSCGSGTLAATAWLGRHTQNGTFSLELIQPGGILKAEIQMSDGLITDAKIGGPVTFEEPVEMIISI